MKRSKRNDLLARYELRSRVFAEQAKRRQRPGRPANPVVAEALVPPTVLDAVPSPRELEVLRLIAEGMTDSEIAAGLHVTENTAKSHVRHLLFKLGARSRAHAVALGFRRGLIR